MYLNTLHNISFIYHFNVGCILDTIITLRLYIIAVFKDKIKLHSVVGKYSDYQVEMYTYVGSYVAFIVESWWCYLESWWATLKIIRFGHLVCVLLSVIFVNENENENEKDQQFVHENEN